MTEIKNNITTEYTEHAEKPKSLLIFTSVVKWFYLLVLDFFLPTIPNKIFFMGLL